MSDVSVDVNSDIVQVVDQGNVVVVVPPALASEIVASPVETQVIVQNPPSAIVIEAAAGQGPEGPEGPPGPAATGTMTREAGQDLSASRVVVPTPDGSVVYADNTNPAHTSLPMWITLAAVLEGDDVLLSVFGQVNDNTWTWTPEQRLFLGANGELTQTPPESPAIFIEEIGVADTSDSMFLDPKMPIVLG